MVDIQIVGNECVDLAPMIRGALDTTAGVLTEVGPLRIQIGRVVGNGTRTAVALGMAASVAASVGMDELEVLCHQSLKSVLSDAVSPVVCETPIPIL